MKTTPGPRGMRQLLVLLVSASLPLMLASCSSKDEPKATSTPAPTATLRPAATKAELKTIVITGDDLPAGWKADPDSDEGVDDSGYYRCLGLVGGALSADNEVDGDSYALTGRAGMDSKAAGYSKAADIAADIAALTGAKAEKCANEDATGDADPGTKVTSDIRHIDTPSDAPKEVKGVLVGVVAYEDAEGSAKVVIERDTVQVGNNLLEVFFFAPENAANREVEQMHDDAVVAAIARMKKLA